LVINYAPTSNGTFTLVSGTSINQLLRIDPILSKKEWIFKYYNFFFLENVKVDDTDDEKDITALVDLSKAGAKVGDIGVIQAIFTGEETWYQCADIKVIGAKGSGSSGGAGTSKVAYFIILSAAFIMAL
jgi:hypothetical protein